MSIDVGVKGSVHRIGYHALVRLVGMSSSLDMSDLLAILGMFDDMESCSSCCISICPPAFSSSCSLAVESIEVEILYCQCDSEDDLVECQSCGALFDVDTICPRC
jgi:hypothetical protein